MLITAKEANNLYKENMKNRANSDITKIQTIMKNIKQRAEKGYCYYEYSATISYAMAKTLFENGFKLFKTNQRNSNKIEELKLDDFNANGLLYVRISWEETE